MIHLIIFWASPLCNLKDYEIFLITEQKKNKPWKNIVFCDHENRYGGT